MTDPRPAKLAYLTDPDPGKPVLNVQVGEGELLRFQLTRDQLFALNADTAAALLRGNK